MLRYLALLGCLPLCGCSMLPEIAHQPTLHNPFPQLSKVAVAPFFNLSDEPTVDGNEVALAYFNELQQVPGYEVVSVGTVRQAIEANRLELNSPEDARRLIAIGQSKPAANIDAVELATNTVLANVLLNLDEVISKE